MIETMREAPGVGLAAPQIDVSQQLIVVEYAEEEDEQEEGAAEAEAKPPKPKKLFVLINPEIVKPRGKGGWHRGLPVHSRASREVRGMRQSRSEG